MGQNKKSYEHRKIKQLSQKKSLVFSFLLCFFVYVSILIIFSVLGAGNAWEMWKESKKYLPLLASLSLYRILEYTAPAIILKLAFKQLWSEAFNYQFAFYAFLNAVIVLFGLDFALDIEPFSSAENFIIIIGYVISLVTKDNMPINNTIDIIESNKKENEYDK